MSPSSPDGLRDGVVDATDVEATLTQFAETAAGQTGEWVLELVEGTEADRQTLARLLDPLTDGSGDDLAAYLVAADAPSTAGIYRVTAPGEIEQERGYSTGYLCQLLPEVHDEPAALYVTEVRIVAEDAFALVNWRTSGGYPHAIRAGRLDVLLRAKDEFPGDLTWPLNVSGPGHVQAARDAGIAEEVIAFERGPHEGSLGRIGELAGPFASTPAAPRKIAEAFIADLSSSMGFVAQQCVEALQQWEHSFLTDTVEQDVAPTPGGYRRLAQIADLVGAVRFWNNQLNSPSGHDPTYWFAATPDSERAVEALDAADRQLELARDDYRTALALAAGIATSQQLDLQSRSQTQAQAFERNVALAGSIVLVPGLVATFFGANVPLPGGATWWGTGLVAVLMVLAGWGAWQVLTRPAR